MGFTAAIPAELGDIIGGFTQLFQPGGNLGDLISGILHGAPLFGVFLIVMMLVSFSLRISLMKNAEHKSYATWIGVGSGLGSGVGVGNGSPEQLPPTALQAFTLPHVQ